MWSVSVRRAAVTPVLARYAILLALAAMGAKAAEGQALVKRTASAQVEFTTMRRHNAGTRPERASSTFEAAGISSLTCEVAVDWDTLLAGRTSNSFQDEVLPVLRGTRFLVTLDKNGTPKIAARYLTAPAASLAASRARESIETFAGVIAAAIDGWARYAIAADIPPGSGQYPLDLSGDRYLVAFRNGEADVAVTLDRSFVTGDRSLPPSEGTQFSPAVEITPAPGGLIVTGWAMVFPRGIGRALSVDARYMQAGGVPVPAEMTLHSSLPSFGAITLPLSFNNYQFQR